MTWKFECFQSHCHILKELHEVLGTMCALTIFGEGSFVFSFGLFWGVSYELVTKSFEYVCTI
jgi:hypothetical protein